MRRVVAAAACVAAILMPLGLPARAASAPPTVSFITPSDGATVAAPVEVALKVSNFNLVPAGSFNKDGNGHLHVLIDEEPPAVRSFLPTNDPNIVHMGAAPLDARAIDMSAGRHTLTAVLGDSDHLLVASQPAKITITVAPGVHAKGPLTPACAEVARGQGDIRVAFPEDGGLLQGTISSSCLFPTNGGKCAWTDSAFRRVNGSFDADTHVLSGEALGYTTRQLKQGDRSCGKDSTSALGRQAFTAAFNGGVIAGTIGGVQFVLAPDPSSRLADPAPIISPQASGGGGGGGWSDWYPYAAFAGAAVLLAGAGFYAYKNRAAPAS